MAVSLGTDYVVTPDERRRRRAALLEQRANAADWRDRLLARRRKYVKAHQDLAHYLSLMA